MWSRVAGVVFVALSLSLGWAAAGGVELDSRAVVYHVDGVRGSDEYPGSPEAPFRTLERALRQYRALQRSRSLPAERFVIRLAPGRHELSSSLTLGAEDTPGRGCLVIAGSPDGTTVLSGARELRRADFRPVEDAVTLRRLPPSSRGRVRVLDLSALGLGVVSEPGSPLRGAGPWRELYVNGRRQELSRWPSRGWALLGQVVDRGARAQDGEPGRGAVLRLGHEAPLAAWARVPGGVWLHGFWCHDWYDEMLRVAAVDVSAGTVTLDSARSAYGVGPSAAWNRQPRRFRALNLLEGLEREGQWCLEPGTSLLYAWLPPERPGERIAYATLAEPLVRLDGVSRVRLEHLTFEESHGDGLAIVGDDNAAIGCTFRHLGGDAVTIRGRRNVLRGCDLSDLGGSGVRVTGGDRRALERADNLVENCHIWRVGQLSLSQCAAVHLGGVGSVVRSNLIHDLPHSAILYGGNEHLIELNDIFSACLETGDAGVLYTGRSWASRGNVVRHNYIHHSGGLDGWSMGVYLDDCDSGDAIVGNVFADVSRAVFIGGGRDNLVENNVFVNCRPALHLDDRGLTRIRWNAGPNDTWDLHARLQALDYQRPPWTFAYPRLARILDDQPALPLHNTFQRNLVVGGTGLSMKEPLRRFLGERHNWYLDGLADPGFRDADHGDYGLADLAAVREHIPGFESIPFDRIGLKRDDSRLRLPDARQLLLRSLSRRSQAPELRPLPTAPISAPPGRLEIAAATAAVVPDGDLADGAWRTAAATPLAIRPDGSRDEQSPAKLLALAGDDGLLLAADVRLGVGSEGVLEVALQPPDDTRPVVYRAYPDGRWESVADSGLTPLRRAMAAQGVQYGSCRAACRWTAEFQIPWTALGGRPASGASLGFNASVTGVAPDGAARLWRATGAPFWRTDRAGALVLP